MCSDGPGTPDNFKAYGVAAQYVLIADRLPGRLPATLGELAPLRWRRRTSRIVRSEALGRLDPLAQVTRREPTPAPCTVSNLSIQSCMRVYMTLIACIMGSHSPRDTELSEISCTHQS